jgi:hypothetical protein
MSAKFVNADRETPLLFPEDLRKWVAENHIVHFIIDDGVRDHSIRGYHAGRSPGYWGAIHEAGLLKSMAPNPPGKQPLPFFGFVANSKKLRVI